MLWGGRYDNHHDFYCSSDSSSAAALDVTIVNASTMFKWDGGGEGKGKEDGDCVDKDGDGELILSSMATTIMVSVLMPKMVANNCDGGMDGWTSSK